MGLIYGEACDYNRDVLQLRLLLRSSTSSQSASEWRRQVCRTGLKLRCRFKADIVLEYSEDKL